MKSLKFIVIGAIVLAGTSAFADLKSDWQKKLDSYCAAMKKKDLKTCTAIIKENFAPEFKYVPMKGKPTGLDQWLAEAKMEMGMTEKVTAMAFTIDKVTMGKDSAVMKTTIKFEGTVKMDPKSKAGVMKGNSTADQKMVKKGGKWWITEIKVTSEKATYNGKPMG